ncbi:rhomboid family intramembrane serine protease [candidate division GN15 bacterium]|nr:rhomboid family intramembrane serine protease [candidate division GN15 bacterium]
MNYSGYNRPYRGGGFRIGPGGLSPFIRVIIIVCAGVFLLQILLKSSNLAYIFGLTPARFFSDFPNLIYQVITYMFLHGGFWHIFFNMFGLWMFGTEIEYTWGSKRFGRFYFLCGLAGALLTLIVHSGQAIPMIGASAAIYGVLVAYWKMFPEREVYLYFLFPIKVKWFVPGFMLLGFLTAAPGVAHMAHLGGAIFAFFYIKGDWRWAAFGSKLKNLRSKRKEAKLEKRRQEAEDVMKRVDDILDKINEVGIENISKEDRKFLEDASSRLSEKKNNQQ